MALLWQIFLVVGPLVADIEAWLWDVRSFTSDQGIESWICDMKNVLQSFLSTLGLRCSEVWLSMTFRFSAVCIYS